MTKRKKKTVIKIEKGPMPIKDVAGLLVHFGLDPDESPRETFIASMCKYVDLYGCYGLPTDDPGRDFPREDGELDSDKERFILWMQFTKEGAVTFYDRRSDTYMTEGGTVVGVRFGAYIYGSRKVIRLEPLSFPFYGRDADEVVERLFGEAGKAGEE
ncbi:MAG: hypothetical protein QF415_16820 [Candidatus Undinarchaeales archaeon]|jgi:hypothetical protein|nr:hypothetical protein [Candidatus Undinarchaeales archaeon]MDP7494452.1 hypothetical protein [Candidatus Undinarchaeales archaeon]